MGLSHLKQSGNSRETTVWACAKPTVENANKRAIMMLRSFIAIYKVMLIFSEYYPFTHKKWPIF